MAENGRAVAEPPREIVFAYRALAAHRGTLRIDALARAIGWTPKHLARRFKSAFGVGPKTVARLLRFDFTCRLALRHEAGGWASIAADAGFADQAHLAREFLALAGESPTAWARRRRATDPLLMRLDETGG